MDVRLENSGYTFKLGPIVGSGGMGKAHVHATNNSMLGKVMSGEFPEAKIRYLIPRPLVPSYGGYAFAWPVDIGCDPSTGEAKLYVMPKAVNSLDLIDITIAADWLPAAFKYRVLLNKIRALRDLEQANYQRGDMPNAMVGQDGFVTEIDLDSLQVSHPDQQFLCGVAKPDWLAPELIDPLMVGGLGDIPTSAEHDAWAIAVSIWKVLRGDHPFDCRYVGPGKRPSRLERVERGHWPYGSGDPDFRPRRSTPPLTKLDSELVALFRQTFETGHGKPVARAKLADWEAALMRLDTGGDVTLTDDQWRCVSVGGRPSQLRHRKINRSSFKQPFFTAASVAAIGGASFYWSQLPAGENLAPNLPAVKAPLDTATFYAGTDPAAVASAKRQAVKFTAPVVELHNLKTLDHSKTPALWSHLKESQK